MRALRLLLTGAVVIGLLGSLSDGVGAQDDVDPMAPAYFTYTLESIEPEPVGVPVAEAEPAHEATGFTGQVRGDVQVEHVVATDPRASGLLTTVVNLNMLEVERVGLVTGVLTMRLVNDGGAWAGTGQGFHAVAEHGGATVMSNLTGEAGYEGLSMVMVQYADDDAQTNRGFILPSDQVPPMPDPVESSAE